METAENTDTLKKLCVTLYGVYALSALLQFSEITLLPGLLSLVIAYILTGAKKEAAKDTPYASHLRWMSRTFWIGSGVIVPLAIVIAAVLILAFTDIGSIMNTLNGDDPNAMMNGIHDYMNKNITKISLITMTTMVPTVVWWMRRCWIGYVLAKAGKPVEKVTSWL